MRPPPATRRRVMWLAGGSASVLAAAGCAGAAPQPGSKAGADSAAGPGGVGSREVTLQFMYGGDPPVQAGHRAMAAPFSKRYPNVKIEHFQQQAQYVFGGAPDAPGAPVADWVALAVCAAIV